MIASPYSTFAANRGQGFAIGTQYEITEPARLAYWDPSIEIPATTSTRRALACPWSPPKKPAPVADLFAAMFGDSQA
tara:strand:- start:124 stop:354 length:231 start_codon:yes stop_codon:yes gene_type:complete